MDSSTSNRRLLFLTMFLLALASLVGPAFAQKSDGQPRSSEHQEKLREEISKSVAGRLILDAITIKEPDWILSQGFFMPKTVEESPNTVRVSLKKGEESINIFVAEYRTGDDAENSFSMSRSMGTAVSVKIGERGEKIYIDGRMTGLNFRIGNYTISIPGVSDEKLAERFAGHVLEAIKGLAAK